LEEGKNGLADQNTEGEKKKKKRTTCGKKAIVAKMRKKSRSETQSGRQPEANLFVVKTKGKIGGIRKMQERKSKWVTRETKAHAKQPPFFKLPLLTGEASINQKKKPQKHTKQNYVNPARPRLGWIPEEPKTHDEAIP